MLLNRETFMPALRVAVHAEDAFSFLGLVGSLEDPPGTALVGPASGEETGVPVVSRLSGFSSSSAAYGRPTTGRPSDSEFAR